MISLCGPAQDAEVIANGHLHCSLDWAVQVAAE